MFGSRTQNIWLASLWEGIRALWPDLYDTLSVQYRNPPARPPQEFIERTPATAPRELNDYVDGEATTWLRYGFRYSGPEAWHLPQGARRRAEWRIFEFEDLLVAIPTTSTEVIALSQRTPGRISNGDLIYGTEHSPNSWIGRSGNENYRRLMHLLGDENISRKLEQLISYGMTRVYDYNRSSCQELNHAHGDRWTCSYCSTPFCPDRQPQTRFWSTSARVWIEDYCANCRNLVNVVQCDYCSSLVHGRTNLCEDRDDSTTPVYLCGTCIDDDERFWACPNWYNRRCNTVHTNNLDQCEVESECICGCQCGDDDCEDSEDCGGESTECYTVIGCHNCPPPRRERQTLNNYSYKPEPEFFGKAAKGFYIGMELEIAFKPDYQDALRTWMPKLKPHKMFYAKSDSSIHNGFELVTHPFDPEWGLKHIHFETFQELIDNYGALPTHTSCGTHIHMSKDAFSSAHLWKLLQIHHQLPDFCALVGGRPKETGYATFVNEGWTESRKKLKEIAMSKRNDNVSRTVAVNLQPQTTIELRYPAGNINPEGIKKNIQWALALYEFSGYLDVVDIKDGALQTPGSFLWWLRQEPEKRPELLAHIDQLLPSEKPLRVRN